MDIKKVKINTDNPRIIKDEKFKKLVQSIKDFPEMLDIRPIVINNDNMVLGGNMRLKACKEAGLKEIPVIKADQLTPEQQKEFIIKDNVGFGEWQWDVLANEWDTEQLTEWGLDVPDFAIAQPEATEDDYEIPDEIKTDIVLGDLFEIGQHRLLCGDSTNSDDLSKLIQGSKIDLVFSDPPYGIDIVQNTSVGGGGAIKFGGKVGKHVDSTKGFKDIIGDKTTETAKEFYHACVSIGIENYIIWGGNYFTDFLPPTMCWIVWYKKNTGNFADFEMAWTSYNKAAKLYEYLWNGLSREGERRLELTKRVHPTQKPVGLTSKIFNDFEFTNCLDGFGGSGTTMVTCHEHKKVCYMVEMLPDYCQVIVDRMRKLDPALVIKRNGEVYG